MEAQRAAWLKAKIAESPDDYSNYLELADLHIMDGQYQSAYDCISALVVKLPESIDVLTTAGALAVKLERYSEALEYLERASLLDPNDKNIYHNIGLLNATMQRLPEAEIAFRRVVEIDPVEADGWNDLAVVLAHEEKIKDAKKTFEIAIGKNPNYEKSYENYIEFCICEKMREDGLAALEKLSEISPEHSNIPSWKDMLDKFSDTVVTNVSSGDSAPCVSGLKIAFFATQDSFADGILAHLAAGNEIKRFSSDSVHQMAELMQWADLAWFEWCDQLLIQATKLHKTCKIICRLHSYEAFTQMPAEVDWTKIDRLILVNQNVADVLNEFHNIVVKKEIIHNGVDLNKFTIPNGKTFGKKICSLGYINYKKNPGLLLYCFKAIHDYDPEFEFFIAGRHQDPRIKIYFDHMIKRLDLPIHLQDWVEDVPAYLKDKDFVISTSLFESFHYSIAEGMASGLLPLVHAWPGAENVYPEEYLFNTPDECVTLLDRLMKSDRKTLVTAIREYISNNFSQRKQIVKFEQLIADLDRQSETATNAPLVPATVTTSEVDYGKVSIIIPTYNRAEYLEEAIESALNQTYQNCEIIVCDDASTDDTAAVLKKFENSITVLKHQTNRGVSAALNTCIRSSDGEYISWLSSDDVYMPEKVQTEIEFLHQNPGIGMVYSDFFYIDRFSNRGQRANVQPLTEGNERTELFQRNPINGCSVMFRKQCLNETGYFDEELGGRAGYTADGAMWHKMVHFHRIRFLDKPLLYYRVHGDNVANRMDTRKAWSEYREYMKNWFTEQDALERQTETVVR
ncbi:MAG: glycosyltransferase [Candidatus Zixiibacteriota bacterium]